MKLRIGAALLCLLAWSANAQTEEAGCAEAKIRSFQAFSSRGSGPPELNLYDVKHVLLDLKLSNTSNAVAGYAEISAVGTAFMSECRLELHPNLQVDSALFNGVRATVNRVGNFVGVVASSAIAQGDPFRVRVYYRGTPPNGGFFNGFSNAKSGTWGNQVTWSLSEPNNAMQWWPCKQVLTDKFDSSEVRITVDTGLKAGSNGVLSRVDTLPGNKLRYVWKYNGTIAYYLISVAVARYVEYNFNVTVPGIAKPVFVQNFIYDNPATLTNFRSEIDKTGDMLKVFSRMFGPYPFAHMKYGHCMAPFSGGMEHNTMTSQGTFNTTLTAHELAHQWWGDHVTCKSWQDIWVNEGFARYCEYLYLQTVSASQARQKIDALNTTVLSNIAGSVFVTDTTNPSAIFSSRLTYDKGSLVIHMLRWELNDDTLFFRVLRAYQAKYAHGNAGVKDFKAVAEQLTGRNLTQFFNQWYYGQGFPTFDVEWNDHSGYAVIRLKQRASYPSATPLFVTPVQLRVKTTTGDTLIRLLADKDSNDYTLNLGSTITGVTAIDPDQWILNDTGTISNNKLLKANINSVYREKPNNISVYPVPANDKLMISGVPANAMISVLDISGRVLLSQPLSADYSLEIGHLQPGTYMLVAQHQRCRFIRN